jgi:hypothetical protein
MVTRNKNVEAMIRAMAGYQRAAGLTNEQVARKLKVHRNTYGRSRPPSASPRGKGWFRIVSIKGV